MRPVGGVVVSACPSPPAPHHPAELKSHSARKKAEQHSHGNTRVRMDTRGRGRAHVQAPWKL